MKSLKIVLIVTFVLVARTLARKQKPCKCEPKPCGKRRKLSCCPEMTLEGGTCTYTEVTEGALDEITTPDATTFQSTPNCGISSYSDPGAGLAIINGITSRPNEFPWAVGLYINDWFFCGGSVLNDRWILTAAHCVDVYTEYQGTGTSKVTAGDLDKTLHEVTEQTLLVARAIAHGDHDTPNEQFNNDIGLLELDGNLNLNAAVGPICLPSSAGDTYANKRAVVIGWGHTSYQGVTSDLLQYTWLTIMSNDDCEQHWGSMLTDEMMCATDNNGDRDTSVCNGDSGGALAVQNPDGTFTEVGIVSFGYRCAEGRPAVFARVSAFLQWIPDKMA